MAKVEFHDVWVRVAKGGELAQLAEPRWAVFEEPLRVVVLQELETRRVVPVWMGSADAFALLRHQNGRGDGAPIAAAVMASLLEVTGGSVGHVEITGFRDSAYLCVISVLVDGRSVEVSARASDALNLAVRMGVPIFVSEEVMREVAFPISELAERLEEWQGKGIEAPLDPGEWLPLSPQLISELKETATA